MIHALVVDGYTYYKIMSMLLEDQEIESLSFVRKEHAFVPKMEGATGTAEYKMLTGAGIMMNMIPAMCCGF